MTRRRLRLLCILVFCWWGYRDHWHPLPLGEKGYHYAIGLSGMTCLAWLVCLYVWRTTLRWATWAFVFFLLWAVAPSLVCWVWCLGIMWLCMLVLQSCLWMICLFLYRLLEGWCTCTRMVEALWTKSLAWESFSSTSTLRIESVFAASKNEVVNVGPDDASYLHCRWVWCCNHRWREHHCWGCRWEWTNTSVYAGTLKCLTFGISQEPNSFCAKDFSRFALIWFYKPFFNVWSCVVFLKQALSCEGSDIWSRYLYLLHSLAFSWSVQWYGGGGS